MRRTTSFSHEELLVRAPGGVNVIGGGQMGGWGGSGVCGGVVYGVGWGGGQVGKVGVTEGGGGAPSATAFLQVGGSS